MKLQQLYSYVRQAIDDYQMIADGDRIAVGISGGKDSLTLLYALSGLRRFYPKKFELAALTVDLGFDHYDQIQDQRSKLPIQISLGKICVIPIMHIKVSENLFPGNADGNPVTISNHLVIVNCLADITV